jgi:Na+-driven multidrug efflux pump
VSKPAPALIRALVASVVFTALLMLPFAILLWIFADYIATLGTTQLPEQAAFSNYLKTASGLLLICFFALLFGAYARSKKWTYGTLILQASCVLVVVMSAFPLISLLNTEFEYSLKLIAALGWAIFILPYAVLTYLLKAQQKTFLK